MAGHIVGRESSILKQIQNGSKTVEARLAKLRFRKFRAGDRIRIREDIWAGGQIVSSQLSSTRTTVVEIEKFSSFVEMFRHVDFKKVNPDARSAAEALDRIRQFYTPEDEQKYGVLAIHFKLDQK
jgi:ASC-1-like (ASCH) protein